MRRRIIFRRTRGQSLIEMAFSLLILVALLSGLVDLGRAFFTKIDMDTVISEGANWGAAYPGCIPSANNTTGAPQVDVHCQGTNSVLCRMTNENKDLSPDRITNLSVEPINAKPGDMVKMSISYKFPLITPFIQAMFGRDLQLTSEVKEVVRGTNIPASVGSTTLCAQGSINPTIPVYHPAQAPAACTGGLATLGWGNVSATGYHIWRSRVSKPFPAAADVELSPVGAVGADYSWTDPNPVSTGGAAGSRTYSVTSYNTADGVTTDSDPVYIDASCPAIQVTNFRFESCSTNGANLSWTLPATIDTTVTGWQMVNATTNTATGSAFAATDDHGNFVFPNPSDGDNVSYYMQAVDSGNHLIGLASNTVLLPCPPTNAEIGLSLAASPSVVYVNDDLTYTFVINNTGPGMATGVQLNAALCTAGTGSCPAYTFVSATSTDASSCTYTAPTAIECLALQDIAAGSSTTVTVVVKPTTTGTISIDSGSVTETARQISTADDSVPPLLTSIYAAPSGGLDIQVTGPANITAGAAVTYTITAKAIGPGTVNAFTLKADTPNGLFFQTTTGDCTTAFPCNWGDVPAGTVKTVQVTYLVPAAYLSPNPISFSATVTSTNTTPNTASRSTTTTVATAPTVNVQVTGPTTVSAGRTVTYTITARALGTGTISAFKLTASTPSNLVFKSTAGDCTTAFPCIWGDVPAGTVKTVQVTYGVPVNYPITNAIAFTAVVTSTNTTPASRSGAASTTVTAPVRLDFWYSGCHVVDSNSRTYTFGWASYNLEGVSYFRITDGSEHWFSPKGDPTQVSLTIPTGGGSIHKNHSNDTFYVEAMDAYDNVLTVTKSNNVTFSSCPN